MTLDALKITALLQGVDESVLSELVKSSVSYVVAKDDVVFRAGDEVTGIFLIESGKIKFSQGIDDAKFADAFEILGSGHIFGEVSIYDRCPRLATAVALTDCQLRHIATADVERLIADYPVLARVLLFQMARRLRLRHCAWTAYTRSDVPGRVAFIIVRLATRFGEHRPDGSIHVHHDSTQLELASLIGASRETVNKALSDFASRRWINLGAKSFVVLNWRRLRQRAGEPLEAGQLEAVAADGRWNEPDSWFGGSR
ncbi:MAG: Crp/Fnr family transcriptional regulator [Propionibacteriaceae bacterium]|jgi:CRP-like cAMP-binding protein|nr:Crp/Fnr family transcriptional regulator [Propionibacteriaceae bacterium]